SREADRPHHSAECASACGQGNQIGVSRQAQGVREKMGRKRFCVAIIGLLFVLCLSAEAQEPSKIPRIGYLAGFGNASDPGEPIRAFQKGLKERGYTEGQNILVEYRYIEGISERVPKFVTELIQLKVDALVIPHTGAIFAAKQATRAIPIIIISN